MEIQFRPNDDKEFVFQVDIFNLFSIRMNFSLMTALSEQIWYEMKTSVWEGEEKKRENEEEEEEEFNHNCQQYKKELDRKNSDYRSCAGRHSQNMCFFLDIQLTRNITNWRCSTRRRLSLLYGLCRNVSENCSSRLNTKWRTSCWFLTITLGINCISTIVDWWCLITFHFHIQFFC